MAVSYKVLSQELLHHLQVHLSKTEFVAIFDQVKLKGRVNSAWFHTRSTVFVVSTRFTEIYAEPHDLRKGRVSET